MIAKVNKGLGPLYETPASSNNGTAAQLAEFRDFGLFVENLPQAFALYATKPALRHDKGYLKAYEFYARRSAENAALAYGILSEYRKKYANDTNPPQTFSAVLMQHIEKDYPDVLPGDKTKQAALDVDLLKIQEEVLGSGLTSIVSQMPPSPSNGNNDTLVFTVPHQEFKIGGKPILGEPHQPAPPPPRDLSRAHAECSATADREQVDVPLGFLAKEPAARELAPAPATQVVGDGRNVAGRTSDTSVSAIWL